ncbi:hypothetical protein OIU79_009024 [Salix purpurea]|uniref:Uncharacterized protein n=1 Tax=Salix purpurea TaxID=77065 RepID=A0A9Q0YWR0_SALPP|nr:hypothetical protein OIU79_009024 [Salix purpurea]
MVFLKESTPFDGIVKKAMKEFGSGGCNNSTQSLPGGAVNKMETKTGSHASFSLAASDGGQVLEQTARNCSLSGESTPFSFEAYYLFASKLSSWQIGNRFRIITITNCKFESALL